MGVLGICTAALLLSGTIGAVVVEPHRHAEHHVTAAGATPTSSTTSTTLPAPPPRLLISYGAPPDPSSPKVMHSLALDGTGERPETRKAVRADQFSPDGKLVTYSKDQGSSSYEGCGFAGCSRTSSSAAGIAVANADGSEERVLTTGGYDRDPRWSPRGDLIAFTAHLRDASGAEVDSTLLMTLEGAILDRVETPKDSHDYSPAFSPDGLQVAFFRRVTNGKSSLMAVTLQTHEVRTLATGEFAQLAWSPDGQEIAAARHNVSQDNPADIVVVPLDGRPVRTLYKAVHHTFDSPFFCYGSVPDIANVESPQWSPDSSIIAFGSNVRRIREDSQLYDIALVGRDGSGFRIVRPAPPPGCSQPYGRTVERLDVLGFAPGDR